MKRCFLTFLLTLAAASPPAFAATLTVTNLADSGPGTLRDRIAASADGDRITFEVVGTITLSSELTIGKSIVIAGPGVPFLKISGNGTTRVFNITNGSVGMHSLIICDGRVVGTNGALGLNGQNAMGGGILIASNASLSTSTMVISNNAVVGGNGGAQDQLGRSGNGGHGLGGAVASLGRLSLVVTSVAGNSASGGMGGVVTDGASPGVGGHGWGGGAYTEGRVNVTLCAINDNRALSGLGPFGPGGGAGGGIYIAAALGTVVVSVIASNSASGSSLDTGGGIHTAAPFVLQDLTIVGNEADSGGGLSGPGNLSNTILAGNTASAGPDGSGSIISSDYNLIQRTNGLIITGATAHDLIGVDPLLTPLQDNGGYDVGFALLTMVPLPDSPVIDKGKSGNSDLRAFQRPLDLNSIPNASGGNGSDIGSVEFQPPSPLLNIQRANNNVVLYWSTNAIDFLLQCVTNVFEDLPDDNWTNVMVTPVIAGDHFYVTNTAAGPHKFYRLIIPVPDEDQALSLGGRNPAD